MEPTETNKATNKAPRILAALAAVVLLATAAFHATGYGPLLEAVNGSALSAFFRKSLPGIWLFFSWHLVAVACALGWVSVRGSRSARPLLVFASVLVCADALFVFSLAGFFAGTALLAAAAACTVIAVARWQRT